jgi:alpha-tubulin suppressor-like RCC1 family protein
MTGIASGQIKFSDAYGKAYNTLWGWGQQSATAVGVLGQNNNNVNYSSAVQIGSSNLIQSSSMGGLSNPWIAFIQNGSMFSCGGNSVAPFKGGGRISTGQLGLNDAIDRSSPTQIGALTTWKQICAGNDAALALKNDGTIWTWGRQGGPNLVGAGGGPALSSPVQLGSSTDNKKVYMTGIDWTCMVKKNNDEFLVFGNNASGELGVPALAKTNIPINSAGTLSGSWKEIESQGSLSIGIRNAGSLWLWGYVSYVDGPFGVLRSSPVQIGGLTNWSQASCTQNMYLSVKTDGTLWAAGDNSFGMLGQGTGPATQQVSSPVQVGALTNWAFVKMQQRNCFAVKTDGTLWGWGSNLQGGWGDSERSTRSSPVQVGGATNWSYTQETSPSNGQFHQLMIMPRKT